MADSTNEAEKKSESMEVDNAFSMYFDDFQSNKKDDFYNALLKSENTRQELFSNTIKNAISVALVLYSCLIATVFMIIIFGELRADILSVVGIIFGLPSSAIFFLVIHSLKSPLRPAQEAKEHNLPNEEMTLPSTQAINECVGIFERITNAIKSPFKGK